MEKIRDRLFLADYGMSNMLLGYVRCAINTARSI